ncbi:MAG: glycoside hydrolase family 9 protein [Puniceicoccaceae bacterium]
MHLSYNQWGYRPESAKTLTLAPAPGERAEGLPERIPFYLNDFVQRVRRDVPLPEGWGGRYFRWPFDPAAGRIVPESGGWLYRGELRRIDSRWGVFWQGDFSDFRQAGQFHIETDFGGSFPFLIEPDLHERLQAGFLNYLYHQRSGFDLPGYRRAEHLDDGVLETDGRPVAAAGGWYNAGDMRKWLYLTLHSLDTLAAVAERGHPGLRERALDEIRWGNRYFHAMLSEAGQVWEDIGGGDLKPGLSYERDWWFENHAGCGAGGEGCHLTDNRPGTGDERKIRTHYNPFTQFMFVHGQCRSAVVLPDDEAKPCLRLAERAWRHGRERGHDGRTLFVAQELRAGLELLAARSQAVAPAEIEFLARLLLDRQDLEEGGLTGSFLEADGTDGFRSIAFAALPAMALLRLAELAPPALADLLPPCREALARYLDGFVLADARSNPFGYPPYGIYLDPPHPERQTFRDAGRGRGVRSFIHPFNPQEIVHGTSAAALHMAAVLARAGRLLARPDWREAAEAIVHWTLGHNPQGLCLHSGVGHRRPVPFSSFTAQLPDTVVVGHIGRPDDSPYLETSPLVEWSTQEIWDIPNAYLTETVLNL